MIHHLIRPGAVVVALALLAPRGSAEVVTLVMETNGTTVTYNPHGGPATNVGSGPFQWSQSTPANANFPTTALTYCIDLEQFIQLGQAHTFAIEPNLALAPTIGTEAKGAAITELFDRYYLSGLTSTANQHAFQLALWELVYDGAESKSLGEGRIQASNAQAQAMLTSLGTPYTTHDLAGSRLLGLVSDTHQDQIVVVSNPPASAPAPPGAVLAGIGVLALLGRAYRTRRAAL